MPDIWFEWGWRLFLGAGLLSAVSLSIMPAPYGRHYHGGWGPVIPARWGWLWMESVSPLAFSALFLSAERPLPGAAWLALALWWVHYGYRAFVYPFRLAASVRPMPVLIVALAFLFNIGIGSLNGWGATGATFELRRTAAGLLLFAAGWGINHWSDARLLALRGPGADGYQLPRGGLFRWISCPNYLGEILEWSGFALVAWNPAAAAFAFFSLANLAPRARSHHRWYRARYPDYPPNRRALIPGLF